MGHNEMMDGGRYGWQPGRASRSRRRVLAVLLGAAVLLVAPGCSTNGTGDTGYESREGPPLAPPPYGDVTEAKRDPAGTRPLKVKVLAWDLLQTSSFDVDSPWSCVVVIDPDGETRHVTPLRDSSTLLSVLEAEREQAASDGKTRIEVGPVTVLADTTSTGKPLVAGDIVVCLIYLVSDPAPLVCSEMITDR